MSAQVFIVRVAADVSRLKLRSEEIRADSGRLLQSLITPKYPLLPRAGSESSSDVASARFASLSLQTRREPFWLGQSRGHPPPCGSKGPPSDCQSYACP